MTERKGRCLCGSVIFKLTSEPLATRVCWCRDCQHLAANGTVNVLVSAAALEISGSLSEYIKTADSGNQIAQQFCPTCGTHLFGISSARPQFRVVRAGNFDDPSSIKPSMNIWSSSAPGWACLDPTLDRVDHQPSPPQQPSGNAA
ncbi:GFA family protein [Noviherbaspirillum sp. UKPF54]|uniref:GFA family protein n=1 Tax=Noviherbaspirillum sp. UKPF54 TaxID=2601898 RepID=UPI0011B11AE4|nr:GFA family protein [Noviherbaspirillum sp. UKPF54]QDZ29320.1 GFA family protein [Noviherbaspirillum sp. UKPF54]